jgi:hypothetical protein
VNTTKSIGVVNFAGCGMPRLLGWSALLSSAKTSQFKLPLVEVHEQAERGRHRGPARENMRECRRSSTWLAQCATNSPGRAGGIKCFAG